MMRDKSELESEFEELVSANIDGLYRFAFARMGNSSDAQDVVQETFLKAYRNFEQFKGGTETKYWFRKILINSICDFYRKKSRSLSTVSIDQSGSALELVAKERSDEFEIDRSLQQALNAMSDQFVIPLLLREVDDASYEEISEILDIPLGTVMSRLSRARSQLRRKLVNSQRSTNIQFESVSTRGIHNELQ